MRNISRAIRSKNGVDIAAAGSLGRRERGRDRRHTDRPRGVPPAVTGSRDRANRARLGNPEIPRGSNGAAAGIAIDRRSGRVKTSAALRAPLRS